MLLYMPVLTIAGIAAGLVVGFLSDILITRLKVLITDDIREREGVR